MRCSSRGRSGSPGRVRTGRGRGRRPLRLCRQTIFGRPGSSRITIGRDERQTQVPAPSSRAQGRARKILDPAKGRREVRAGWISTLYARRASARRLPRPRPRAHERSPLSVIAFLPSARSLTRPSLDQDTGRPLEQSRAPAHSGRSDARTSSRRSALETSSTTAGSSTLATDGAEQQVLGRARSAPRGLP